MAPGLSPGTRVEVRTTFDRSWASGFEVVTEEPGEGYQVRRLSDGEVLPARFTREDVRRERERSAGMWWI